MPSTTIANFDAGRIPDVADEANFHADATYVFEHMASDIIPGINANLDWMNAALTDAETIVDQVGTLTQNLATAPVIAGVDEDGGDFSDGSALIGGTYTVTGDWENGPRGAAAENYAGVMEVYKRAFTGGAALTQVLNTSGGRPIIYTRVGKGDPYMFSDWVASVYAETNDQAENLAAFLAVFNLPTTDGTAGQVLATDAAGNLVFAEPPLGSGQTWQDMTASRADGVVYQNTTGRTIAVYTYRDNANSSTSAKVSADNVTWHHIGAGSYGGESFIVPDGYYYKDDNAPTHWMELRS